MGNKVETKTSCEKPKLKPEIADTFSWAKEERQKLKEEVLIEDLRKKLIAKYPEQKCFFETAQIRVMELGKDNKEHEEVVKQLGTNIFLLYSQEGKLLSYLDKDGNTMRDMVNFNFEDDFKNLYLKKKFNNYIRLNKETGKLELFEKGKIYNEGSKEFNDFLYGFLPLWNYLK